MGSTRRMATLGVIAILLGVLAMLAPILTGFSVVLLLGVIVVAAGIVRILWAVRTGSFRGLSALAVGGLTLLCGVLLLANPVLASGLLTILLALYFLCDGIGEILASMQRRPLQGWGWLMFGGIVSVLLSLMLWRQFPLAGAWAMGVLIGIKLLMIGLIMLGGASIARELEKPDRA